VREGGGAEAPPGSSSHRAGGGSEVLLSISLVLRLFSDCLLVRMG
jgi:hypothetical protein